MLDWRMHHCGCIPLSMNFSITPPFKNRRLHGSRSASVFRTAARFVVLGTLLLAVTGISSRALALEAGYAKADITPVLGTPLAGRLERWGRGSEFIHDPLSASCLYLDDGNVGIFLVSADLYAVSPELRTRVLELAPRFATPENIVLVATHTHSGPGGMDRGLVRRVNSGRSSPRVLEETAQQIAGCMRDAYNSRRRAAVGHAVATWTPPTDLTGVNVSPVPVTVLRVEDSDGIPIATVITVPLTPDNVGSDELLTLSADFPGFISNAIEETTGAGSGALFFSGASGDSARTEIPATTSWEAIERLGRSIGTLAVDLSERIECGELPIAMRASVEPMPLSLGDSWLPDELSLTQFTVGGLTMTFVPLGVSPGSVDGLVAAGDMQNDHNIVSFANGFAGHVVPQSAYAADTASARLHYFGPYMAERLTARIHALLGTAETDVSPESASDSDHGPTVQELDGLFMLTTTGTPETALGAALSEVIQTSFEQRIHEPGAAGTLLPGNHTLAHVPWFVDASPVALLQLAYELRPAWAALDADQRRRLKGYADGAGLPLEAAWLLQHEEALKGYAGNAPSVYSVERTLMFAIHGDRAGAERLLAGVRIPWTIPEVPLIHRSISETGIPIISLTPAHAMGTLAGMNGSGIVVCAVRNSERGRPRLALPPLAMQLERALGLASTKEGVLEALGASAALDGFDLFIADAEAETAVVVRGSAAPESPSIVRGLTTDRLQETSSAPKERNDPRELLVNFMRSAERIVSADELASFVAELEAKPAQGAPPERFVSIVFEPRARQIRVRVEGVTPGGEFVTIPLEAAQS